MTHKTEIFYILDVQPGGFVFLCDFADWQRIYRRDTFLAWLNGARDERYERFKFVPRPGDVVVIDRLNVVHSVVGCVLAEFATVSETVSWHGFSTRGSSAKRRARGLKTRAAGRASK